MAKAVPFPTQLIIGDDTAAELRANATFQALKKGRVAVVSGRGKTGELALDLMRRLDLPESKVAHFTVTDAELRTLHELEAQAIRASVDLILCVGGGLPIDAAKVVGTRTHTPVVLVPTAISSDAICSPVARIKMDEVVVSVGVNMPEIVVVDLDVLASCPERLFRAGIGDLISNQSAIVDWTLAHHRTGEGFDTFSRLIARNAMDAFLNAWAARGQLDAQMLRVTAESLIMSGIAMAIAGSSRPCSGGEHLISHALDHHCGARALHGEQVALGVLVTEHLHAKAHPLDTPLAPRFADLGLPLHYSALGYSREDMKLAIQQAPLMRSRHTVLSEHDLTDDFVERLLDDVFDG
jgi:glycerol-1-phosphate dehydrogenase [NAD(P)+]